MIYTVTFNPSIDYIVNVDNFMTGVVNRTSKEIIFPGGKGINVSMVLKNLGEESTALGFMAGFTGDEIQRQVEEIGVNARLPEMPSHGFFRRKVLPQILFTLPKDCPVST